MVEREGRPSEQSFEQKMLQGEVIFSKQLTLHELLNLNPEESDAVNPFDTFPFTFEVRGLGDSLLHIVSFSETKPVSLLEFFPLLQAAKPGGVYRRESQDVGGVSADWRIILPEVREKEPTAKELYDFHKEYVPEFSEFQANHFELFWKVLESGKRRKEEVSFFNQQLDQFIDEREFFAKYGRGSDFSNNPEDIQSLAICYSESFKPFLEEKGFNIPPNPDPKDSDRFLETRKLFYAMDEQEQRALGKEFYEKSVDEGGVEAERKFGRYLRWCEGYGYPGITTLIGEGGELNRIGPNGALKPLDAYIRKEDSGIGKSTSIVEVFWKIDDGSSEVNIEPSRSLLISGKESEKPDSFRRLDDGQIELRKRESFIRISIVEGENGYRKVKLDGHHLTIAEEMVPLIAWKTDKQTGKRSYYCGKFDQLPQHDTLLGQLVVAAYSPEVRDQMPKEIKMKGTNGKEVTQPMLEAQAILLVPRYSNQFLTQSPVISGLEALAK